jgi:hypothetical protein
MLLRSVEQLSLEKIVLLEHQAQAKLMTLKRKIL